MMRIKSEGVCKFCKKTFSGSMIANHLQSCAERLKAQESESKQRKVFLLKASAGPFWVFFEVGDASTLKKVDSFLRKLWLECCGHLSAFTIGDTRYISYHELEYGERTLNVPLKNVLKPGIRFIHEYDFGTTTDLDMKCISERFGEVKGIDVLARNDLPKFTCNKCGRPAKEVCSQCICEGKGFLCESCAKNHKCGGDMLLPVVNSPRMGMCGYTGEAY